MKQAGGGDKEAAQMRGKTGKEDEKKGPSIPFEGSMHGSVYVIRYVAQEAGMMDLHVWATEANAETIGGGVDQRLTQCMHSPMCMHSMHSVARALARAAGVDKQVDEART